MDRSIKIENIKQKNKKIYWVSKRYFDVVVSILLIPLFFILWFMLFTLNRYINPGPVFFVQKRMGKDCVQFNAIKFRSMTNVEYIDRGYDDPIERNRITPLGSFLRAYRLDEIPQIINVLKGEMSLIGPRPDYYDHALIFSKKIENYKLRHLIKPGISGLSQIRLGYAEGLEATKKKVVVDNYYIENAGFILDIRIIFGTLKTILSSSGS